MWLSRASPWASPWRLPGCGWRPASVWAPRGMRGWLLFLCLFLCLVIKTFIWPSKRNLIRSVSELLILTPRCRATGHRAGAGGGIAQSVAFADLAVGRSSARARSPLTDVSREGRGGRGQAARLAVWWAGGPSSDDSALPDGPGASVATHPRATVCHALSHVPAHGRCTGCEAHRSSSSLGPMAQMRKGYLPKGVQGHSGGWAQEAGLWPLGGDASLACRPHGH